MAIDYETKKYGLAETSRASRWETATLKSYFQRGIFRLIGKADPDVKGKTPRLFSLRDVLMLAVANRAWRAGMTLADSFKAGVDFAHTGETPIDGPHRMPGMLIPDTLTVMIAYPTIGDTKIVGLTGADGTIDFATLFFSPEFGRIDIATVILLSEVMHLVFMSLVIDWREHDDAAQIMAAINDARKAPVGSAFLDSDE